MINFNAVAGVLRRTSIAMGIAAASLTMSTAAHAELVTFKSYTGNVGLSTDGWGGLDGVGVISASAPTGSTVLAAYLYSATFFTSTVPSATTLDGNALTYVQSGDLPPPACCTLKTYRADVTDIVKAKIDGGGGGVYDFDVNENSSNSITDGHALVVVYENAALPDASVGILDGFARVEGDTTSINFADPLDPTDPGFFAEMYLGISFSCCVTQKSVVEVNDLLLSENAGNKDDGENGNTNGNLITVGSFDDPLNGGGLSYDDDREAYDLTSFIGLGDTSIKIDTINASRDDNIFLAAFYVKGEAGFNEPPPSVDPIPLPAPMLMLLTGLAGFGVVRRRKSA